MEVNSTLKCQLKWSHFVSLGLSLHFRNVACTVVTEKTKKSGGECVMWKPAIWSHTKKKKSLKGQFKCKLHEIYFSLLGKKKKQNNTTKTKLPTKNKTQTTSECFRKTWYLQPPQAPQRQGKRTSKDHLQWDLNMLQKHVQLIPEV